MKLLYYLTILGTHERDGSLVQHGYHKVVPVPWCETHDLPMEMQDRHLGLVDTHDGDCVLLDSPQVFRIEVDNEAH